jgi:hypothetical protein
MGNWDFDPDEAFFLIIGGIFALIGTIIWYLRLARVTSIGESGVQRKIVALAPPAALAGLAFVLMTWADPKYVVGHFDYQLLFTAGGLAGLWIVSWITGKLGVDVRDDALERRNVAAAVAVGGALLGAMTIYAACNVGAGPTIWTTIFPAVVATGVWVVLWLIVEIVSRPAEAITIERDLASALRHAAFLIGAGLILGRGMAGDWTSWEGTFGEFRKLAWPAGFVAVVAIVLNLAFRPTPTRPKPSVVACGLIPAAVVLALSLGYVISLGPADIGKEVITYEEYTR